MKTTIDNFPYQLRHKLGEGGMGEVWYAVDGRLARPVALKLLPASLAFDDEVRRRFHREIRIAAALNHPNIITVFESGEFENKLYIAMEYVEGTTVRDLINQGTCTKDKAIDIIRQTLMGLNAAHSLNIIHRDIKPENIMIRKDGYVKILDFGLAKIINSESSKSAAITRGIIGTPLYMSPEQASGMDLDERSDIFSLGSVFYELLSGRHPFDGENIHRIILAILGPDLPPQLEGEAGELMVVVYKALQKDREKRYKSTVEILQDLAAYSAGAVEISIPADEEPSVVVIPFTSSDSLSDFSSGVTEQTINLISGSKKIRIMSLSASKKYSGFKEDLSIIGQELKVRHALMGNIRQQGTRIRLNCRLVELKTGLQTWGDRFETESDSFFDAEDELSEKITTGVFKALLPDEHSAPVVQKNRIDPESTARDLFLTGVNLRNSMRQEDIRKSIEFFRKTIEAEPGFSNAHAKLSEAYILLFWMEGDENKYENVLLAKESAQKALELDPGDPGVYVSLGIIETMFLRSDKAREYFEKALAISPNHPDALGWLAEIHTSRGEPEKASIYAREAIKRDPANAGNYIWLSYSLFSQGRYQEARDNLDRAVRLDPRNPYVYALLLFTNLALDNMEEAKMLYEYMKNFTEENPITTVVKMIYLARIGTTGINFDEKTTGIMKIDGDTSRLAADFYAIIGDKAQALKMLSQSVELNYLNLPFLDTDPFLAHLRSDPDFRSVREKLRNILQSVQDN